MPEDQSIHDIPAGQRVLMLENMASSPAFALLTDKWNQTVLETLDARIFAVSASRVVLMFTPVMPRRRSFIKTSVSLICMRPASV